MKLRNEDLKEIARLVDEGYGYWTIAGMFNYSKGTMQTLVARYKKHGLEAILHGVSKTFSIEEKIAIINRYYAGESKSSLSIEINVSISVISKWISKYEKFGYNGLIDNRGKPGVSKMGRPRKNQDKTSTNETMVLITNLFKDEIYNLFKSYITNKKVLNQIICVD